MTTTIIWTIAVITGLGLLLALALYLVAQRFKVEEDPRIEEVEKAMPGANCGGCGFAGCHAFAEAAVKAPNLDNNYCPVGGNETMKKVAAILGYGSRRRRRWWLWCAAVAPAPPDQGPMNMTARPPARSRPPYMPGTRAARSDVSAAGTVWLPVSSEPCP